MARLLFFLLTSLLVLLPSASFSGGDYLETRKKEQEALRLISSQEEAEALLPTVADLLRDLEIRVRKPLSLTLVTPEQLDAMYQGVYRGAEIGLYRWESEKHAVYVMKDLSRDQFVGTLAHEVTHGWQVEECPRSQEQIIREGFANWVEYRLYLKMEAFELAGRVRDHADPVYGVGFKEILALEDALGVRGVVQKVRSVRTLADLKEK